MSAGQRSMSMVCKTGTPASRAASSACVGSSGTDRISSAASVAFPSRRSHWARLPGTEIAFDQNVECEPSFGIGILPNKKIEQRLARFRQINMDNAVTHHDALEFPDGQVVLLTRLCAGQRATVLQLPIAAHPASAEEAVKREIREPSLLV
jgi:hypothetical protein